MSIKCLDEDENEKNLVGKMYQTKSINRPEELLKLVSNFIVQLFGNSLKKTFFEMTTVNHSLNCPEEDKENLAGKVYQTRLTDRQGSGM